MQWHENLDQGICAGHKYLFFTQFFSQCDPARRLCPQGPGNPSPPLSNPGLPPPRYPSNQYKTSLPPVGKARAFCGKTRNMFHARKPRRLSGKPLIVGPPKNKHIHQTSNISHCRASKPHRFSASTEGGFVTFIHRPQLTLAATMQGSRKRSGKKRQHHLKPDFRSGFHDISLNLSRPTGLATGI